LKGAGLAGAEGVVERAGGAGKTMRGPPATTPQPVPSISNNIGQGVLHVSPRVGASSAGDPVFIERSGATRNFLCEPRKLLDNNPLVATGRFLRKSRMGLWEWRKLLHTRKDQFR